MGLPAVTHYLVRWRGHTSADDEWLREEELVHHQPMHRVSMPSEVAFRVSPPVLASLPREGGGV